MGQGRAPHAVIVGSSPTMMKKRMVPPHSEETSVPHALSSSDRRSRDPTIHSMMTRIGRRWVGQGVDVANAPFCRAGR
jgi:hypothetical protein